jgi:hypothetical protein
MGYLQDQVVQNYAGTAARGSAIGTAVSEGMVSYLADTNLVEVYDGSAWKQVAKTTGSMLQVQHFSFSSTVFSSTTTYAATGLSGTITLSSSTNKVLVIVSQNGLNKEQADTWGKLRLMRSFSATDTQLAVIEAQYGRNGATGFNSVAGTSMTWLDSPATTATLTYRTEFARDTAAGFASVQNGGSTSTLTLIEVSA